jgi:hemolysin III
LLIHSKVKSPLFDFHDFVSSGTHLAMAGFMVFVGLLMHRLTRKQPLQNALAIDFYATTAVALFALSGIFHSVRYVGTDDRRFWQLMDQSAIFFLIFGSNVPLVVYFLPPRRRNILLVMMLLIALTGCMLLWTNPRHEILAMAYVGIGVLGMLPMRSYFPYLGWWGTFWVLLMASTYTLGAICETVKWPVFIADGKMRFSYHEMLHLFVIGGTLAHVVLIIRFVIPHGNRPASRGIPVDPARSVDHNSRVARSAIPPAWNASNTR